MKEKKININGLRELLLVGVVLLLCVVWTVMNPQFLSVNNITNILRQASYTAIAAVGMTMIIIIGEIDLSAGSLVCAAGLVGAVVCKNTNNVLLAVLAAILVGALVGLCNGILCAVGCLPGFIATLASMTILRGLAYIITGGNSIVWSNDNFTKIGTGYIGPVPIPVIIMIIAIIFGVMLTTKFRFGRYIYAVGGNMETSRWSGIPVVKVKILVYVIMGFLAGLGGALQVSVYASAMPDMQYGGEMDVIAACVIGGVSFVGGTGKISGVVLGVFILRIIFVALQFLAVSQNMQYVIKGLIILIACAIDMRKYLVRK